jgi:hypothetical protein
LIDETIEMRQLKGDFMVRFHDDEVHTLIRIIRDQQMYPTSAEEARAKGRKWLKENDSGLLDMSKKSRKHLEEALAEPTHLGGFPGGGFF